MRADLQPVPHTSLFIARRGRPSIRRWGGWAAVSLSIAVYGAVALILHQPFHEGARALRFFDLRVYRGAAKRVVHGIALYRTPILHRLSFTYPPFAALLFVPLAFAPLPIDELAVTALNISLLIWLLRRALLISSGRFSRSDRLAPPPVQAWSLAALAAAAALWLEPASVTLGYGQIDLLIAALVVFDLSRPDSARTKGAAIGLAAAIKLTPLLFIAYLLLSGRRRAAALGAGVFAASIAIAFAVLGQDASRYWPGLLLDSSRIGNGVDVANQSLQGAISRLAGSPHPNVAWHIAIGLVALIGLALAVRASRAGDEAAGFSLTALSALLVSPISWTHHWTLVIPAVLLLGRRAYEQRSWPLAAATAALVSLGYSYLPEHVEGRAVHTGSASLVTGDPYVIAAMIALAATAAVLVRARLSDPLRPRAHDARLARAQAAAGSATSSALRSHS